VTNKWAVLLLQTRSTKSKSALTACRSLNFRIFLRPNAVSSDANGAAVVKANMTAG
jgi:hypothetical protein